MSFRKMTPHPLVGKWRLVTKTEQKVENGTVVESHYKAYKPGKKTYEFMADNKLTIIENAGKQKEKKRYILEGNDLYVGKEKTPDNKYSLTFSDNKVTMLRSRTKAREGKTTVETDELLLERIP